MTAISAIGEVVSTDPVLSTDTMPSTDMSVSTSSCDVPGAEVGVLGPEETWHWVADPSGSGVLTLVDGDGAVVVKSTKRVTPPAQASAAVEAGDASLSCVKSTHLRACRNQVVSAKVRLEGAGADGGLIFAVAGTFPHSAVAERVVAYLEAL